MGHHQRDDHRHQFAEQVGTILQLFAIDRAVPGRTAMDQLVAQGIEAVKHHPQQLWGVAAGKCQGRHFLALCQPLFPLGFAYLAAVIIPEALQHKRGVQQYADTARELLPDQLLDMLVFIQVAQFLQKAFEGLLFGEATIVIDFSGISRWAVINCQPLL